jgi:hypothetical protein
MTGSIWGRSAVPIALSGSVLIAAHVHGYLEVVLPVVPLLLLVVSLLLGLYPGCDTLVRLAERIAVRPRATVTKRQRRPESLRSHAVSGGLLIAFGLAKRPPPLAH